MKKNYRNIVVEGKEFKYKVGKDFVVIRNIITRKGYNVEITKLLNISPSDKEEAQDYHCLHVLPSEIASWIKVNLCVSNKLDDQ